MLCTYFRHWAMCSITITQNTFQERRKPRGKNPVRDTWKPVHEVKLPGVPPAGCALILPKQWLSFLPRAEAEVAVAATVATGHTR